MRFDHDPDTGLRVPLRRIERLREHPSMLPAFQMGQLGRRVVGGGGGGGGGGPDPLWDDVLLLLNFEDGDGDTSPADTSSHTWAIGSISSGVEVDTAGKKWGTGSLLFSSAGSKTLYYTVTQTLTQADDFAMQGWFYFPSGFTSNGSLIKVGTSSTDAHVLYLADDVAPDLRRLQGYINGTLVAATSPDVSGAFPFKNDEWVLIEYQYIGSSKALMLAINGVCVAGGIYAGSNFSLACDRAHALTDLNYQDMRADSVRMTVNKRIAGSHNLPTAAFTADADSFNNSVDAFCEAVVFLLHLNGTNGSTTITEETGSSWTVGGGATISTAQSKFGGSSLVLGASGPRIECSSYGTRLYLGLDDFTIEAFTFCNDNSSTSHIFDSWNSGTRFLLRITGGNVEFYWNAASIMSASAPSTGAWHHIAVSRVSGIFLLFIDGALAASDSTRKTSAFTASSTATIYIGGGGPSGDSFDGYIDEVRVTKGFARYAVDFTPPTAAFLAPCATGARTIAWDVYVNGTWTLSNGDATALSAAQENTYVFSDAIGNGTWAISVLIDTLSNTPGHSFFGLGGSNTYTPSPYVTWNGDGTSNTSGGSWTIRRTFSFAAGDLLDVFVDTTAGHIWVRKNGTFVGDGNPATGADPTATFSNPTNLYLHLGRNNNSSGSYQGTFVQPSGLAPGYTAR